MSDLQFDAASHTYTVGGVAVPSVTQILAPLNDLSMIPPATLQYKRDLGTAVHAATELHDSGELDESTVAPVVQPYLDAWIRLRAEKPFEIVGLEHRVFHPVHRYAGTYDRLVVMDGKLCVLDIKTGAMYPSYGPQLAAYKNAVEHETGRRVQGRYAVELRDDGTYRLHPMTDSEDWAVFLSCLTLHRYRNKHAA
ncbi:PD-(D/E)XK nuclease family protein [Cupriavidus sp. DB3]|uniref:PD-(D/E)XK nuclease family protein n=1 Tax=Cupriavidus sp. DB3 TaxID=2873259 RepID=UPI001CF0E387|nr:PD-(D/E)XK nuclease family protein [Cupriavidus sp. DB3]MCA7086086.1 PD-(D/E)XK nuclease family protein [Cupriavidus sp. DB3]